MKLGLLKTAAAAGVALVLATGAMAAKPAKKAATAANPVVEMKVHGRGTVVIELFPKDAPKTVAHLLGLVDKGFYNGILIHRVVPGFVVQAGDPMTKKYTTAQFNKLSEGQLNEAQIGGHGSGPNGANNNIPFEANSRTNEVGYLAMALIRARSATGDSQWFINLVPNHGLDGDYCVFGKVTKGMDVVKKIKQGDKIDSMRRVAARK